MVAGGHPPPSYQESKKLPGAKVRGNAFLIDFQTVLLFVQKLDGFDMLSGNQHLENLYHQFLVTRVADHHFERGVE